MELDYCLSRSIVRLTARETTTTNHVTAARTTSYVGSTAELLSVADPEAMQVFVVPDADNHASTTSAVVFRDDRRLASIDTSSSGSGPAWVRAGIGAGAVLLGAVVSAACPPAGIALAGAGVGRLRTRPASYVDQVPGADGPTRTPPLDPAHPDATPAGRLPVDPTPADPMAAAYARQHPVEDELRTGLTEVALELSRTLVAEAAATDVSSLKDLRRRLEIVQEQVAPYLAHRAAWDAAQVSESTAVDLVDLELDELPGELGLREFLAELEASPTPSAAPDDATWREWAIRTKLAVTVDPGLPGGKVNRPGHEGLTVRHRVGTEVSLVTWSLTWHPPVETRDDGGEEVTRPGRYTTSRVAERRARVVARGAELKAMALDVGTWKAGKLRVTFNALGEPSEIGGEGHALTAEALAAVPSALVEGLGSGDQVARGLVPGSATQAGLERALAVAKARAELSPLVSAPPARTPMQQLADEVQLAELQARLEAAKAAVVGTHVVVDQG